LKNVVRISGLVKFADTVRLEIGRGVGGQRKLQLQQSVFRSISQIDQILKQRGAKPAQLAAPSRRAYQFLSEIRWDAIPENAQVPPPPQPLRWKGLNRFADRMMVRLALSPSENELDEIAKSIEQMSRRIELSIQQAGVGPEHMTAQTREWRAWFAWLAERENFNQYVAAVARAKKVIEPAGRAAGNQSLFIIQFRPTRHIYKMQPRGASSIIILPTAAIVFDEPAFTEMASLIFTHSKEAKRRLVERLRSESYTELNGELEALGGVVEGTRGAYHDLIESFDRVNEKYFAGQMERPRLTWSRSFTGRKFGHYDHVRNWVMVSSTLDSAAVPAFVVDYLMFHELLHKKYGIRWVNNRGHAHTREFYDEEHTFERYQEAEDWLTKLARG